MGSVCNSRWTHGIHRILATGCAALIFALGLFAASPTLHGQLHHDTDSPAGDACAVVLFADGVAVPIALDLPPPPVAGWHETTYGASSEIYLDSPRYLLRPERGPPLR